MSEKLCQFCDKHFTDGDIELWQGGDVWLHTYCYDEISSWEISLK